jgi:hypothetical protein
MDNDEMYPVATLDLRGLHITLEEQDGDLAMLVDDGDVLVEFSSGLNGTWDQAIAGAERLAATAAAFATELRRRRPYASATSAAP